MVKDEATTVIVYPLWSGGEHGEDSGGKMVALDVIKTLVDSVTSRDQHTLLHLSIQRIVCRIATRKR